MTETARLVSAITASPQREQELISWIRKAGFYGSLAGLGAYLDHLESLLPALTRVVQLAPGLAPFAEELCWGLTLKPRLDRVLTDLERDRLRPGLRFGKEERVTAAASGGVPESGSSFQICVVGNRGLLLHAAAVLLDFVWRGHRGQLRRYRHTWGLIQLLRRNEPWSALFPDPADGRPTESWVNSPPDPIQLGPDLSLDQLDTDEIVELLASGIEQRRVAHLTVRAGHLWKAVDPWTKLGQLLKATDLSPTGGPQLVGQSAAAADALASLQAGEPTVPPERQSDRRWGVGADRKLSHL
jgi:hypothetical protein